MLGWAFPGKLTRDYAEASGGHRLRHEIVATQLANHLVDRMGFTFCYRMQESVGAPASRIAQAYMVVSQLFGIDRIWTDIEALDGRIATDVQYDLYQQVMRLGRRTTRWLLRNNRKRPLNQTLEAMRPGLEAIASDFVDYLPEEWQQSMEAASASYRDKGVPAGLAEQVALMDARYLLPGTVSVALELDMNPHQVAELRFGLSRQLSTFWLLQLLIAWEPTNRWQDFARESYVDELEGHMRRLTMALLREQREVRAGQLIQSWRTREAELIDRFADLIASMQKGRGEDLSVFTVAMRELKDLVDASVHWNESGEEESNPS